MMLFVRVLAIAAVLLVRGTVLADSVPFFAMDTAYHGNPTGQILDVTKANGFAGVGGTLGNPDAVKATADDCAKRGLKLFAVYGAASLTREKLTVQQAAWDVLPKLKDSGTIIWLHIDSGTNFPKSSADGDDIAVAGLRLFADAAASNGLKVAIYPHVGNWTERAQDAARVAKKVDRENFGATFNLCHCLMLGDEEKIPEILTEAAPKLFVVTINGADTGAGHTSWNRLIQPLDQGSYDVGIVLRKLRDLNWRGPVGLQAYGIKLPTEEILVHGGAGWKKLNAP
jgi:sugar phosphate isomerase/epimerase